MRKRRRGKKEKMRLFGGEKIKKLKMIKIN